jgi:hypothetical protein
MVSVMAQILTTTHMPRILSVKLQIETDPDHPLEDFLGSFSAQPKSKVSVNHRRRQGTSRELEWFNPATADNRADAERDYLEMMEFVHDRKWMMRVVGSAKVSVPCGSAMVEAKVGPCYADGLDSDDDEGCKEAKNQVREELTEELQKLGFTNQEIAEAMDHAEIEEN